ncbi:MAG TPA: universal stress protein [Bacteroidales bacterium]|nr:universal stress protein [Bacteroidales bacterium]
MRDCDSPPRNIRVVLVALDYEPSAQMVAETGYSIAAAIGAETVLMHVVADNVYYTTPEYSPVMGFTGFSSTNVMEQIGVEELRIASMDYLNITKHHLGDDSIRSLVVEGDTAEGILNTANNIGADLIVMGSHSRRGLDKVLMGNIAEDVLKKTQIPVLVIPTKDDNS